MGQNDEGSLGALGAFAAAGKELPCLTETGGNEEVLALVKEGKIYASVALQFGADMAQSFDALVNMIDDPEATGVQLTVPQEVVKARQLIIVDELRSEPRGDRGRGWRPASTGPVPTGHDVPRTVSVLVFLRDRGIFMLWGLLILVFAVWCSPYFFTVDNAILIANAGALTALFAAGVGIGVMTGVLDLSLPGTAALASCVCGWLLTHGHATWLSLLAGLGVRRGRRAGQRLHHAARLQPDHRHHRHALGADRPRRRWWPAATPSPG